jgi:uncharacterized protein (UPF0548 family)
MVPTTGDLSYTEVGATRPGEPTWSEEPSGYRRYERTVRIGQGPAYWKLVTSDVLARAVKIRSGSTASSVLSGITVNAPDAIELAKFYAEITGGAAKGDSRATRSDVQVGCRHR